MTKSLDETCVDSLQDLDVFGGDAKVVEVDLELPSARSSISMFSTWSSLSLFVVTRASFVEGGASVEALASSEAPRFCFFFAAMWSCSDEPRVGTKTFGVGHYSEQRSITIVRFIEGEPSRKQSQSQ